MKIPVLLFIVFLYTYYYYTLIPIRLGHPVALGLIEQICQLFFLLFTRLIVRRCSYEKVKKNERKFKEIGLLNGFIIFLKTRQRLSGQLEQIFFVIYVGLKLGRSAKFHHSKPSS